MPRQMCGIHILHIYFRKPPYCPHSQQFYAESFDFQSWTTKRELIKPKGSPHQGCDGDDNIVRRVCPRLANSTRDYPYHLQKQFHDIRTSESSLEPCMPQTYKILYCMLWLWYAYQQRALLSHYPSHIYNMQRCTGQLVINTQTVL